MHANCLVSIAAALLILASTSHAQTGLRHDAYGDPLPPGAVLRLGTTRLQTRGGFAWTPDGKFLITMKNGTVFFWDMEDGHCSQSLSVPLIVDPFFTYGSQLALSRDGQRLVCTDFHGSIAIWNLETSEMISQPAVDTKKHEENLALAIHPDGKSFITLRHNGELQFRDMATAEVTHTLKLPEDRWYDSAPAAFSPDGRTLAICDFHSRSIFTVNVETKEPPKIAERSHAEGPYSVAFLHDGRLVSVGLEKPADPMHPNDPKRRSQITFWDATELKPTAQWPINNSSLGACSIAVSSDARTMVSVYPTRMAFWDVPTQTIIRTVENLNIRNAHSAHVEIDPSGKRVAVNDRDNFVSLYDIATGQPLLSTGRHQQGHVVPVAWAPDGSKIATGDSRGDVRVWSASNGKQLIQFRGPSWGVFALRFSPDGKEIILCGDEPTGDVARQATGPIQWFEATSGKKRREHVLEGRARLVTPSPDGSLIAVAIESGPDPAAARAEPLPPIVILEADSGKQLVRVEDTARPVAIRWSPDGKSLFACDSTGLLQIDIASGQLTARHKLEHRYTNPVHEEVRIGGPSWAAFTPNGSTLFTSGGDPEIYGWSAHTGEKRWTIKADGPYFRGLAVSPDESALAVIASQSDSKAKTLRLFDIPSQRELTHFDLGVENCERLAFSPDGSRILIGFYNGTALVYDLSLALARQ